MYRFQSVHDPLAGGPGAADNPGDRASRSSGHSCPMLFHETVVRKEAGHVLWASRRVSGIPDFRLCALADGIRQFLLSQIQGVKKLLEQQNPITVQPKPFDPYILNQDFPQ